MVTAPIPRKVNLHSDTWPAYPESGTRLRARSDSAKALPMVNKLFPWSTAPSAMTTTTMSTAPKRVVLALATRGGRTRTTRPIARRTSGMKSSARNSRIIGRAASKSLRIPCGAYPMAMELATPRIMAPRNVMGRLRNRPTTAAAYP